MGNNRPIETVKSFPLEVAIWQNTSSDGRDYFNVTIQRCYKDANGEYQTTGQLRKLDLPSAALLLQQAWGIVCDLEEDARREAKAKVSEDTIARYGGERPPY